MEISFQLINSKSVEERAIWERAITRTNGLSAIEKVKEIEKDAINERDSFIKKKEDKDRLIKEENAKKITKYLENFIKSFDIQYLDALPVNFAGDIYNGGKLITERSRAHNLWFSSGELMDFVYTRDLEFHDFNAIMKSIRLNLLIIQIYPELIHKNLLYTSETMNYELIYKGYYELFNLLQEDKIQKLHRLIKLKENIDMNYLDLIAELIKFSKKAKKDLLMDKLKRIRGSNLNEFASSIYETFGENFEQDIEYAYNYIAEKNHINFSQIDLVKEIETIKENKRLSKFETELFKNDSRQFKKIRIEDIDKMNGFDFENFSRLLFQKMGYKVKETKKTGDQGADLIMEKEGDSIAVQTKRYSNNKVGNKAIQEIVASLKYYNCKKGIVLTNSTFSKSAEELALKNKIELIDRKKLKEFIEDYF